MKERKEKVNWESRWEKKRKVVVKRKGEKLMDSRKAPYQHVGLAVNADIIETANEVMEPTRNIAQLFKTSSMPS